MILSRIQSPPQDGQLEVRFTTVQTETAEPPVGMQMGCAVSENIGMPGTTQQMSDAASLPPAPEPTQIQANIEVRATRLPHL